MTSEIAILNKTAVALAADSAVSIGSARSTRKTYNSANKLFALSKHRPVGVMVYSSAEFMGVPWETLIKMYRADLGTKALPRLADYVEDLKSFLRRGNPRLFSESDEQLCRQSSVETVVDQLAGDLQEGLVAAGQPTGEGEIHKFVLDGLRAVAQSIADTADLEEWDEKTETSAIIGFRLVITERFRKAMELATLTPEIESELVALCSRAHRKGFGPSSGVVVAGFGEDDVFPNVLDLRVHGVIKGGLGHGKGELTEVSHTTYSVIRAFAQQDMVNTFMDGIHPAVEAKFSLAIEDALLQQYPAALSALVPEGDARVGFREFLVQVGTGILQQLTADLARVKGEQSRPIIDAVKHLERDDLASLAESLVQLTSLRKRVSLGPETVGGPIDVAVISKGDGFVWMKRKHYFDPKLNHNFFSNY